MQVSGLRLVMIDSCFAVSPLGYWWSVLRIMNFVSLCLLLPLFIDRSNRDATIFFIPHPKLFFSILHFKEGHQYEKHVIFALDTSKSIHHGSDFLFHLAIRRLFNLDIV